MALVKPAHHDRADQAIKPACAARQKGADRGPACDGIDGIGRAEHHPFDTFEDIRFRGFHRAWASQAAFALQQLLLHRLEHLGDKPFPKLGYGWNAFIASRGCRKRHRLKVGIKYLPCLKMRCPAPASPLRPVAQELSPRLAIMLAQHFRAPHRDRHAAI
jgi:hypothetical protein